MSAQHDMILENLQQRFPMVDPASDHSDTQLVVELLSAVEYKHPSNTALAKSLIELLKQRQLLLSSAHYATLRWVEEYYSNLLTDCGFVSALGEQLLRLTPALAAAAINDSQFFTPQKHPLHNVCNQLCKICIGWHQDLGRSGQSFVKQVATLVEQILSALSNSQINYQAITDLLEQFETSLNARSEKLERRAIETEMGKLKTKHAKEFVAKALNEQLQSKQLPLSVQRLLQSSWYDSLQLIYLRHGSDSAQWSSMTELVDKLIWTLQPVEDQSEEHTQRLYKMIPQVTRQLRKNLFSIQHDATAISDVISIIEEQHFKVLKGQALEYDNYKPLSVGSLLANTSISSSLLEAIEQQQVGQWYSMGAEGSRIKLVLKEQQQRQLLFVNQAGLAALDRNYEEFAYLLTSGEIQALNYSTIFTDSMMENLLAVDTDTADDLLPPPDVGIVGNNNDAMDLSDDSDEALPLPEVEYSEQAMDAGQDTDKDIKTTSPQAEVEQTITERPQAAKAESHMPLGSWVRFLDKGQEVEARLVACLQGDRHIFVNQAGFRQREASAQELADLSSKNLFEVTDTVSDFAQSIQAMISKLRGADNGDFGRE